MNNRQITGIASGFEDLDRITGGFQKGELIVIGARPSLGKTTLALSMVSHISFLEKIPTAFFSLEMENTTLKSRIMNINGNISASLFVIATPNMSLTDLCNRAHELHSNKQVEIIFIDYLGLIIHEDKSLQRNEQVSHILKSLKRIAVELQIPLVLLCQLPREPKQEAPSLANLGDMGSIGDEADLVLFLHRNENESLTDLIVAKQKNGYTGVVKLDMDTEVRKYIPVARENSIDDDLCF